MKRPRHGILSSLSFRYVSIVLAAELVFGSVLGLIVGLSAVRTAADERERCLRGVSLAVAASLMPVIADQDPSRIKAQLASVAGIEDARSGIICVRVKDSAGTTVAESDPGCTCDYIDTEAAGWLGRFTSPQAVLQEIAVDGMPVGMVEVQFEPPGLDEALWRPLGTTSLVVVLAVVVSGTWATWFLMRNLVEPIEELQAGAESIAAGRRDVRLGGSRTDELGRLADALDEMTEHLDRQERALFASYRTLEYAHDEQARMRERVQQAMQAKSDFVAVASHELRSPLAIIRLYAEMLEEGDYGDLPEELREAVDSIISASARMASIVAALIDVALLERNVMPLEFTDIWLDESVREAVRDADRLGAESGVSVRVKGRLPRVRLRGDRIRLRQVLDNLLSNAVKYSEGADLVRVAMSKEGGEVRVEVRDRGRGVPLEHVESLFEPFSRIETGDAARTYGIGLGLPISARIAQAHGGAIDVAPNEEGAGTVFTLRLPLARRPEHVAEMPMGGEGSDS